MEGSGTQNELFDVSTTIQNLWKKGGRRGREEGREKENEGREKSWTKGGGGNTNLASLISQTIHIQHFIGFIQNKNRNSRGIHVHSPPSTEATGELTRCSDNNLGVPKGKGKKGGGKILKKEKMNNNNKKKKMKNEK